MHIVPVIQLTPFTARPDQTAAFLYECIKRLGGDVTITLEQMNEGALKEGEEPKSETLAMIMEPAAEGADGQVTAVRIRHVTHAEAEAIAAAQIKAQTEAYEKALGLAQAKGATLQ